MADSGLYIGVSVAYSASVMGSMHADYTGEQNAFFVPGAFKDADFDTDTVIPLQLSVGAAINNDIRIDFSYLRYSGLEYPGRVESSNGAGGYVETTVDGGAITANATMLNVYYNIDRSGIVWYVRLNNITFRNKKNTSGRGERVCRYILEILR